MLLLLATINEIKVYLFVKIDPHLPSSSNLIKTLQNKYTLLRKRDCFN
jgi:hypothetical protein